MKKIAAFSPEVTLIHLLFLALNLLPASAYSLELSFVNEIPADEDTTLACGCSEIVAGDCADDFAGPDYFPMDIRHWLALFEASESWETAFSDEATVEIVIRHRRGGINSRGAQTNSRMATFDLQDVKDALIVDATNEAERQIYQSIPVGLPLNGTPPFFSNEIEMTTANAKALGLTLANAINVDDSIVPFGYDALIEVTVPCDINGFPDAYDVDQEDGIEPQLFDYTGVLEHEIAHALGFVSSVDKEKFFQDLRLAGLEVPEHAAPTTPDIWRFSSLTPPQLGDTRQYLQAPARFFVSNPIIQPEFSRGARTSCALAQDPITFPPPSDVECSGFCGCGAGHWRNNEASVDGQPLLMVQQPNLGVLLQRQEADTLLLDMIGYDRGTSAGLSAFASNIFFIPVECKRCLSDDNIERLLAGKKPNKEDLKYLGVEDATHYVVGEMHIEQYLENPIHFLGAVRFEVSTKQTDQALINLHKMLGNQNFRRERIPPRITQFTIHAGEYVLDAIIPKEGNYYDSTLGRDGGFTTAFRMSNKREVVGIVTLEFLATQATEKEKALLSSGVWQIDRRNKANRLRTFKANYQK